ncbi:MogA/MoaB family molybdenum cofactor biosynthesis protein [Bhargavaea beijingensis]|uniref:Molybdenum cofactor biosynthesis protein B n=1 Tax=Bhargavaea beijingensis TaxID=426756 RepID=A0A1G6XF88_9BACL|nr:MogA/MoaB family molybdenum cofactor biosynthesis protein [Bhargavaea beijingensis]RSK34351.1 molybdenum cofactor biosynthesis protein [Bhargavaea beijingensis]SDD75985.1 molybdenum cofactor biosynthesis protein B [Bhargavaea beijingensis]
MAHGQEPNEIRIAILTVSDTRTEDNDTGGALIEHFAELAGLAVAGRGWVADDTGKIRNVVTAVLADPDIDAIITTGGTGIAERDVTIEAIRPLLSKELDGFGELFRYLSFAEDVGTKAMLSRAAAGTAQGKAVFILPGSRGAVRLAMERLIIPEIRHVVAELRK